MSSVSFIVKKEFVSNLVKFFGFSCRISLSDRIVSHFIEFEENSTDEPLARWIDVDLCGELRRGRRRAGPSAERLVGRGGRGGGARAGRVGRAALPRLCDDPGRLHRGAGD